MCWIINTIQWIRRLNAGHVCILPLVISPSWCVPGVPDNFPIPFLWGMTHVYLTLTFNLSYHGYNSTHLIIILVPLKCFLLKTFLDSFDLLLTLLYLSQTDISYTLLSHLPTHSYANIKSFLLIETADIFEQKPKFSLNYWDKQ
jgi:hypothetical protein